MVHILSRGASTNPHLLRGELPRACFSLIHFCVTTLSTQHWTQRKGVLLEALFRISEGYFFGPHHLIMAALLYFEEKVIRRRCSELMPFHFFFHDCCVRFWSMGYHQILSWSASVYSEEVIYSRQVEIMTTYRFEPPGRPARRYQLLGEHPRHIPEGIPIASPTISRAPPVTPASSEPSTSAKLRMAIPISDIESYATHLDPDRLSEQPCSGDGAFEHARRQMLATQAQHTAILKAAPASFRSSISC
ncbi:hypothetical protein CK203_112117 [Vitis vinifera]|uniref:Uncharacterized protein n=1 Tax=Vitis vinifera TaxID=29760 RepID=A0A438FE73_VITVI|nr:hypothetical protein CK203_112117 [Vitis vinifera]